MPSALACGWNLFNGYDDDMIWNGRLSVIELLGVTNASHQLQVIESLQDQCVDGATGPPADRMQALHHIVLMLL